MTSANAIRHDWTLPEVSALFDMPFMDLLYRSATIHREYFNPSEIQLSTLLSIKTGGCAEDCAYCPQSSHYDTGIKATKLMAVNEVKEAAIKAKIAGASRFCMGAAWRELKDRDLPAITEMIQSVKALGLETCMTLGMLTEPQAKSLKHAGLDYYNHNIDTSESFYPSIITSRNFQDRLDTLALVAETGMKTCCGGIIGMGEATHDRAQMLMTLANLPNHPESVPLNLLVKLEGTPLQKQNETDIFDFIRTIAVARILMPQSYVRLSAGRESMSEETQALCFFAGANSIFYGDKLLTTTNPENDKDLYLLSKLGLRPESNAQQKSAA